MDPIFNESIRQVIKYHVNAGIPINRFLNVQEILNILRTNIVLWSGKAEEDVKF